MGFRFRFMSEIFPVKSGVTGAAGWWWWGCQGSIYRAGRAIVPRWREYGRRGKMGKEGGMKQREKKREGEEREKEEDGKEGGKKGEEAVACAKEGAGGPITFVGHSG